MIKKGIVFIVFLMVSSGLFAFSFGHGDIFHMDVSPEFGVASGSISEFVFEDYCKNTDHLLSRLDWDVVAVPYAEGNISVDLFKYLYLGLSGRIGIPVNSGFMQDYDWMNSCPPASYLSWLNDDPKELTNYSKHKNRVDKYYHIAFKAGGNMFVSKKFIITPYIGYKYDFIEMSASGGYLEYKWNDFKRKEMEDKKIISYAQEINEFLLGFQIDFSGIPRVPIFFDFNIVPGLGKLLALDIHYGRPYRGGDATAFLDVIGTLLLLDGKLSCFYEIDKHNRVGISSFIHYMPMQKGKSGVGPVTNGKFPKNFMGNSTGLGGTSRFMFGVTAGYQFKF